MYQGYRDTREFQGFIANVSANFDPLSGIQFDQKKKALKREDDLAKLNFDNQKKEIIRNEEKRQAVYDLELLELQLKKAQLEDTGLISDILDVKYPASQLSEDDVKAIVDEKLNAYKVDSVSVQNVFLNYDKTIPGLPDQKSLINSNARLDPIQQLRMENSYWNAIQAELREVELDDAHDLNGLTLYTLKFDVTLIPGSNTSQLGELKIVLSDEGKSEETISNQFYNNWIEQVKQEAIGETISRQRRFSMNYLTENEKNDVAIIASRSIFDMNTKSTSLQETLSNKLTLINSMVNSNVEAITIWQSSFTKLVGEIKNKTVQETKSLNDFSKTYQMDVSSRSNQLDANSINKIEKDFRTNSRKIIDEYKEIKSAFSRILTATKSLKIDDLIIFVQEENEIKTALDKIKKLKDPSIVKTTVRYNKIMKDIQQLIETNNKITKSSGNQKALKTKIAGLQNTVSNKVSLINNMIDSNVSELENKQRKIAESTARITENSMQKQRDINRLKTLYDPYQLDLSLNRNPINLNSIDKAIKDRIQNIINEYRKIKSSFSKILTATKSLNIVILKSFVQEENEIKMALDKLKELKDQQIVKTTDDYNKIKAKIQELIQSKNKTIKFSKLLGCINNGCDIDDCKKDDIDCKKAVTKKLNTSREALSILVRKKFNFEYNKKFVFASDIIEIKSGDNNNKNYLFDVLGINKNGNILLTNKIKEITTGSVSSSLYNKAHVYAVEPKEYAQNISDVGAQEKLRNYVMALKAIIPQNNLGIEASGEYFKRRQTILHAIKRNPLAVGFINGEKEFGWVFGPKFSIDESGGLEWQHTPVQYSFQASIVAPAWWESIKIKAEYSWLNREGQPDSIFWNVLDTPLMDFWPNKKLFAKSKVDSNAIEILLPGDPSELTNLVMEKIIHKRKPYIIPSWDKNNHKKNILVQENKPAKIIIQGKNLWKNPVVYIGNQKDIGTEILPDMKGLVATFDKIEMPITVKKGDVKVDLMVFTSDGPAILKEAVLILPEKKPEPKKKAPAITVIPPYAVKGGEITIVAGKGIIPDSFYELQLAVRPKGLLAKEDV